MLDTLMMYLGYTVVVVTIANVVSAAIYNPFENAIFRASRLDSVRRARKLPLYSGIRYRDLIRTPSGRLRRLKNRFVANPLRFILGENAYRGLGQASRDVFGGN
jgi:hypothetical protein